MYQTYFTLMAEKRGFEPLHPFTDLLAFQASPFSHLGTSPKYLAGPERFELSVSESESDALTTWPWPSQKYISSVKNMLFLQPISIIYDSYRK